MEETEIGSLSLTLELTPSFAPSRVICAWQQRNEMKMKNFRGKLESRFLGKERYFESNAAIEFC